MKNKLFTILKLIIILLILYIVILNNKIISGNILQGFNLFLTKIFPSLFPFFIISSLLINYGLVEFLAFYFNKIFKKLFKVNENVIFIFFMSLLTGTPSNAIYTKELLSKGLITKKDADKIMMFTFFANPVFIISMGFYILDKDLKLTLLILLIHYFSNIIIGIIFRNFNKCSTSNNMLTFDKMIVKINKNQKKFFPCFIEAINKAINTMFLILGTFITFSIIISLINNLNISTILKITISGLTEFSNGLNMLINCNLSKFYKGILMISFLSFGSLSVHCQIKSIINDTSISYKYFFIARLIHVFIANLLLSLITLLF